VKQTIVKGGDVLVRKQTHIQPIIYPVNLKKVSTGYGGLLL
jgi:hypothetical protein